MEKAILNQSIQNSTSPLHWQERVAVALMPS